MASVYTGVFVAYPRERQKPKYRRQESADIHDEHDGILDLDARRQLFKRLPDRIHIDICL